MIPIHSHFYGAALLQLGNAQCAFEVLESVLARRLGGFAQVILFDESVLPWNKLVVGENGEWGFVAFEEVYQVYRSSLSSAGDIGQYYCRCHSRLFPKFFLASSRAPPTVNRGS